MDNLPIPANSSFVAWENDYGHATSYAIITPFMRHGVRMRGKATPTDKSKMKDMLIKAFWRRLGAI